MGTEILVSLTPVGVVYEFVDAAGTNNYKKVIFIKATSGAGAGTFFRIGGKLFKAADKLTKTSGKVKLVPYAPKTGEWLADAMKGWKNGEVIPDAVLNRLRSRLQRNKVTIMQDEWAQETLEKAGAGAQFVRFKDGSAGLLLRPNATRYQIAHELRHYEHWLADPKAYAKLSKLAREEYVFEALQKSNHWRLFNDAERQHAVDYIGYMRKLYGK